MTEPKTVTFNTEYGPLDVVLDDSVPRDATIAVDEHDCHVTVSWHGRYSWSPPYRIPIFEIDAAQFKSDWKEHGDAFRSLREQEQGDG